MSGRSMSLADWTLLVALSIVWGGSFFFVAVALRELQPLTVVAGRVGFAALALYAYLRLTGRNLPATGRPWGRFLAMGIVNNVIPFSLIVWGQVHIDSGLASILNATTPVFTVMLAHWLGGDRLTPLRLMGVLLGLCGVAVLVGGAALQTLGTNVVAQLAVVAAAFSYGCAGIYGRRFDGLDPAVAATGMLTATTAVMLPAALILDAPWTVQPAAGTWAAILGLALVSTALAYVMYFRLLARAGPTNLLLVTLLIPITALLLGAVVLGENIEPRALAGMALIFAGLAAIDGRLMRRLGRLRRGAATP